jgi:5-methylcytosine-specific restriction endonuclease McrA
MRTEHFEVERLFLNLSPCIPAQAAHFIDSWQKDECVRYYATSRSELCNFRQILDIRFPIPYCCDCIDSFSWFSPRMPDISWSNWKDDIIWEVGAETLKTIRQARQRDRYFAILCKRCMTELRPWQSDDLYVERLELPELYSIPICPPNQVNASKRLRQVVTNLYGNKCFRCKATRVRLHIDHILPRSKGGTAVFSNLQPLCEGCGQLKGNCEPEDITLVNDMYFGPYPADSYEGLFW